MIKKVEIVEVLLNNLLVGKLVITPEQLFAFEYSAEYLNSGVSISPFHLPLKPGVFIAKREPFNGLFGVFNDSLPDGWGKLLTDRVLLNNNFSLNHINALDRLCLVGKNGVGALNYRPAIQMFKSQSKTDLNKLAVEVEQILKANYNGNINELYQKGGASGGARPKVLVNIDDKDWIIKFKSSYDPINIGKIEYQYSIAAKKCGIEMPETKLFGQKFFGARRFDIHANKKYHIHSASGLLYASFRYPSLDYTELIKATLALTQNMQEALKMYRQMVFNVLTFNRDDHAKNFSFILKGKTWSLSPAYDLVFSLGFNGQHTTTVNGKGNPVNADLIEVAINTGLPEKKARQIFDEVFENSKELLIFLKGQKLI